MRQPASLSYTYTNAHPLYVEPKVATVVVLLVSAANTDEHYENIHSDTLVIMYCTYTEAQRNNDTLQLEASSETTNLLPV